MYVFPGAVGGDEFFCGGFDFAEREAGTEIEVGHGHFAVVFAEIDVELVIGVGPGRFLIENS